MLRRCGRHRGVRRDPRSRGQVAALCLALASVLSCSEPEADGHDHSEPPPSRQLTIEVLLDGAPVSDAAVMVGGRETRRPTDAKGTALVPEEELVAVGDEEVVVMAAHPEARTRALLSPDILAETLTIELARFDPNDNPLYEFLDPGEPERQESTAQCGHCHVTINERWFDSSHRTSAKNPVVTDLYAGTSSAFGTQAECLERGGTWNSGAVAGGGAPKERCELGDGVLPALNPCATPGTCVPKSFGGCADCHAPGIDGELGGRNLLEATGFAYDYGVHCDVCHKVESVDLNAEAGVAGRLRVLRPSEPSPSKGLGIFKPITFGPWPDVPVPIMAGVEREHYHDGSLCAGCHELEQPALVPGASVDPKRWPSGKLPIHSTYAEWKGGALGGAPCASCHMPPDPKVGNSADLYNLFEGPEGIAAGWKRPAGSVRQHSWLGPRSTDQKFARLAAALFIDKTLAGGELIANVTVKNVGAGHAIPTGEPLRSLILVVLGRCGDELLDATGGEAIPDFGGYRDRRSKGEDWSTWPGAQVGDVVRVVRRPGGFHEYEGFGPFGDGSFGASDKGMPKEVVAGARKIAAVQGSSVVFDAPLPEGDVAYRVDASTLPESGSSAVARAGAAGFAFARVLVGADGRRMVPHFLAVDVASDNRILPQRSFTTTHRFAASCASPEVLAFLVHRPYPLELARTRGFVLNDQVIAEAVR